VSNRSVRSARWACTLLLAGSAVWAPAFAAEPAPAPAPARGPLVPVFAPDARLLEAFGGKAGIFRLADDFVDRMRADARIGHYFEKTKLPELKKQLGDQLCQVLAGPCVYEGDSMKASHAELNISRADSLAQVEILQQSMDSLGIAFADQNRLLARLAPMYREIITRR
jgi:hemoglobin